MLVSEADNKYLFPSWNLRSYGHAGGESIAGTLLTSYAPWVLNRAVLEADKGETRIFYFCS